MEISKLIDGIDISGEDYLEKQLFSDSEEDDKGENLELLITMPIVASTSEDNSNDFVKTYVEQLCDLYIKSKHTKIVKYKKMTPTTHKLKEIHANLWGSHDPSLLS